MLEPAKIGLGLLWYAVFVVATTFHEAAHAWTAFKLGDPTARYEGLVTLDPVPHIRRSLLGMVFVPLFLFFTSGYMVGWASTPFDPDWARAHRRKAAFMALSGPAANLLLILVAALIIRGGMLGSVFAEPDRVSFQHIVDATGGGVAPAFATLVSVLFTLNLLLFVFNLLPLPPLDGSSVITLFFSRRLTAQYNALMEQPAAQMVGIVIAWRLMDWILWPVLLFALNLLYL